MLACLAKCLRNFFLKRIGIYESLPACSCIVLLRVCPFLLFCVIYYYIRNSGTRFKKYNMFSVPS